VKFLAIFTVFLAAILLPVALVIFNAQPVTVLLLSGQAALMAVVAAWFINNVDRR